MKEFFKSIYNFFKGLGYQKKYEAYRADTASELEPLLHCPFASRLSGYEQKTRGEYLKGYPEGAILHYTAGRHGDARSDLKLAKDSGFSYMVIDHKGNLFQQQDLNKWGYHAGKSSWPEIGENVSSRLVGIEVQCGGLLTHKNGKFFTWFNKEIPSSEVRTKYCHETNTWKYFHKFTEAQEAMLLDVLTWLYENNPDVFKTDLILSHHEVSPDRKEDVGDSLSWSMDELRGIVEARSTVH
ncbi:N-acetylmuramoyl-L-alanine amidase [Flavobacterium alkalisoli]|uniref:N-acetylmuramoyl-L-alanine amidase n=1 Tax=Flavobacterium alkalisoli TaxID=2602769 RepID=UPI003A926714